jgi:hypothetical protein
MRVGIFLIAAIVLVVFAIIASAGATGLLFGTTAIVWFFASFLSYLVDLLFGWGYADGTWGRRP